MQKITQEQIDKQERKAKQENARLRQLKARKKELEKKAELKNKITIANIILRYAGSDLDSEALTRYCEKYARTLKNINRKFADKDHASEYSAFIDSAENDNKEFGNRF